MKRLLLPLLAAIALPTAVNANLFSNDLTVKTPLGEKYIIKGKSIQRENYKQEDFINGATSIFERKKLIIQKLKSWRKKLMKSMPTVILMTSYIRNALIKDLFTLLIIKKVESILKIVEKNQIISME